MLCGRRARLFPFWSEKGGAFLHPAAEKPRLFCQTAPAGPLKAPQGLLCLWIFAGRPSGLPGKGRAGPRGWFLLVLRRLEQFCLFHPLLGQLVGAGADAVELLGQFPHAHIVGRYAFLGKLLGNGAGSLLSSARLFFSAAWAAAPALSLGGAAAAGAFRASRRLRSAR